MSESSQRLYLVCHLTTPTGVEYDYTEISQDTENKITSLINTGRIPRDFLLQGKRIVAETILGYTNQPPAPASDHPNIRTWDEFREHIRQQTWYLKAKAKNAPAEKEEKPSPISLPGL